jgi:(p)ppGpp synthase/HD superfamily hydrolase
MSTLEWAIEIAREAHRGQVDRASEEYIGHPLRVMEAGLVMEGEWIRILLII